MTTPDGILPPLNFARWIEDNADSLQPPVSNKQIWEGSDLIVTVVGGGNVRSDYHDDPNPEFFYQLRGAIILKLHEDGEAPTDLAIREGDVFLLPPHVRHSPQRPDPDSIGLVVEYARNEGDVDGFEWFCPSCHHLLHRAEIQLESIVRDLPPLFASFHDDLDARTCDRCGTVHPAPAGHPDPSGPPAS